MSDNVSYVDPLNNEHRINIGIALGLSAAINAMENSSEIFGKLPGYNSAIAVVVAIEARHRAETAGSNIRAAAKAGFDISTNLVGLMGRGKIFVKPMDLEELADFAPESSHDQ